MSEKAQDGKIEPGLSMKMEHELDWKQIQAEVPFQMPLDEFGHITSETPYAVAHVRVRIRNSEPALMLDKMHMAHARSQFSVKFLDGPVNGVRRLDLPAQFGASEVRFLLDESDNVVGAIESASKIAVYRRATENSEFIYRFDQIDESNENVAAAKHAALQQSAIKAMNQFYEQPDYTLYTTPQPPQHEQVSIVHGHRKASVDKGIAEVVIGLWKLELDTFGSCQQRPSGKAYVNLPVPGHAAEFHQILQQNGIDAQIKSNKKTLKDSSSGTKNSIEGGDVLFDPLDVPRVVAVLSNCLRQRQLESLGCGTEIAAAVPSASSDTHPSSTTSSTQLTLPKSASASPNHTKP